MMEEEEDEQYKKGFLSDEEVQEAGRNLRDRTAKREKRHEEEKRKRTDRVMTEKEVEDLELRKFGETSREKSEQEEEKEKEKRKRERGSKTRKEERRKKEKIKRRGKKEVNNDRQLNRIEKKLDAKIRKTEKGARRVEKKSTVLFNFNNDFYRSAKQPRKQLVSFGFMHQHKKEKEELEGGFFNGGTTGGIIGNGFKMPALSHKRKAERRVRAFPFSMFSEKKDAGERDE